MKIRYVVTGIVLGVFTSVPVMALAYFGEQNIGLPFPPFDLFDYLARTLPGSVITFGIDLMINLIRGLNLGSTAETAKAAEQAMALLQFAGLGGLLGGVVGLFARQRLVRQLPMIGLGLGLLLFILFVPVQVSLGFPSAGIVASILWLGLLFGTWGLVLGLLVQGTVQARAEARETTLSRREALYLGASALVAVVAGALGLGSALSRRQPEQAAVPTGDMLLPGETSGPAASPSGEVLAGRIEPAPGTRHEVTANDEFYRIDINTRAPQVDAEQWQLELGGLVNNPMTLTLQEIRSRPSVSQYITLSCISNPIAGDLISTSLWTGLRLKDLLDEAGLSPQAQELFIESTDGFFESVSMEDMMDPRTLLVYEMNGQPLPEEHGYPLRIYIPNRFGMKQPKWIVRMEAIAREGDGYWVERGWSEKAIVRTTSVIDEVTVQKGETETALAGGIAYAGARGISKVEIQIDDGSWTAAELRDPPLSPLTWVQWRHRVTAQPGNHVARVRAYDGEGELQVLEDSPSHPDGATGIHSLPFRTA